MSDRSKTLRNYGTQLQKSFILATSSWGGFIIDCANDLERLEAALSAANTLIAETSGLLRQCESTSKPKLTREK